MTYALMNININTSVNSKFVANEANVMFIAVF